MVDLAQGEVSRRGLYPMGGEFGVNTVDEAGIWSAWRLSLQILGGR